MNTRLEDNYRHKGLRKQLVDALRTKGITDEVVLAAINEVLGYCKRHEGA